MSQLDSATKQDLQDAISDLKIWMMDREVKSIRWFIGIFASIQISYFALTLIVVYFAVHAK